MTHTPLSVKRNSHRGRMTTRASVRGVTLVELMIAMMLGLLVVGSASAIFISNRQTYRATEGLARVQENGRMAFELMSRDLRDAGSNPCGNADRKQPLKLVNVLNSPASQWWTNWNDGIIGYEGAIPASNPANRVAGTDALDLMSGDSSSGVTVVSHNPSSAQFQLNTVNHSLDDNDIAIVCDWRQASIFQITNAQPGTNAVIVHNTGAGSPGNCSKGLGYANPPKCTTNGTPYEYGPNSMIVRLHATRWYVGTTAGGGRSLFRSTVINNSGALAVRNQEIAEGVNNMQLQYLIEGAANYVDSTAVPANRWENVTAVRVVLDVRSADGAGVGGAQLQRRVTHTVTLRNRME